MKRFQRWNGALFAVVLGLAGSPLLQGCGDSGSSPPRRDAAAKLDGPAIRLDGGGLDGAVDRRADVAPGPDAARLDSSAGPETPIVVLDAQADRLPSIDVPKQPDAIIPIDGPAPPVDVSPQPDVPAPDVPLNDDTGGTVPLDVAAPDSPLADAAITDVLVPIVDAGIDVTPVEAGAPGVVTGWPTEAMDFGANPCGGEAPTPKTFTLTNTGGTTVALTQAKFTGTSGYSTDAAGKTIPAGGSLVVTVHAPGVPQRANIPTTYTDVLAIKTDIPNDDQHLITVSQSAAGAILTWDTIPGFGSFGSLEPGFETEAAFHVINVGNRSAMVSLTTTGEFEVTSDTPLTIGPLSASDSRVAFVPSTGGAVSGTLGVSLFSPAPLCQPLPAPLTLTGTSINGAVALSAVSLNFATECGGTATSQTLTVTNSGAIAMTWAAELEAGTSSMFQISSAGGALDAGEHTDITVTPTVPTNATPITDTIEVTSNAAGDTPHNVVVRQTPLGDVVSVVGATTIDLGAVPIVSPALTSEPVKVTLRNDANANSAPAVVSVQMTGASASYFTVTPAQVTIPAAGEAEVTVTFSPGSAPAIVTSGGRVELSATLQWQVGSEANCGFASGTVIANATATLGQVTGVPGQLDFGLVNCGATGLQKQITITNAGQASYSVTDVALVNSTYYAVEYPALPKVLGPEDSMIVTVTPAAIPAAVSAVPDHEKYDGRLTITTDILGDVAHEVVLLMGAQGAIITNAPSPTDWNFVTTTIGQTVQLLVPVVNDGNVPVTPELQNLLTSGTGVFSLQGGSLSLGQSNIVALFQPTAAGTTYTATAGLALKVAEDKVFCQPLPAGWNSTSRNISMEGQSASAPQ